MSLSLYDIAIPTYTQILKATAGVLDTGRKFCEGNGIALDEVVETRLADDMWPFRNQVISTAHHAAGCIDGVLSGTFKPPVVTELDYAGLEQLIADSIARIERVDAAELNARADGDMVFEIGGNQLPFRVTDFVLSFSFPNFYFHATTTYDILRMKGAPLGKRNFLGQMRMKRG